MTKEEVVAILGDGAFFKKEKLKNGDILDVRLYRDWIWVYSAFANHYYWVSYVNNIVTGYGYAGTTGHAGAAKNMQCTTTYTGNMASTSCY